MKCYKCKEELNDNDTYCPNCGNKVIKLKRKKKTIVEDYRNDYYYFSISCIVTKVFSVVLMFISILNILFPWIVLSLIFSLFGLIKYNDKRNIKLIIIDIIILLCELIIIKRFVL